MTHPNPAPEQTFTPQESVLSSDNSKYNASVKLLAATMTGDSKLPKTAESRQSNNREVNNMMTGFSIGDSSKNGAHVPGLDPMDKNGGVGGGPGNKKQEEPRESGSKTEKNGTGYGGGSKTNSEQHIKGILVDPAKDPRAKEATPLTKANEVKKADPRPSDQIVRGQAVDPAKDPRSKEATQLTKADEVKKTEPHPTDRIVPGRVVDPTKDPRAKNPHKLQPSDAVR